MASKKIDEYKDKVNQKQSSNQWDSRLVDAYMRNQSKSNDSGSTQSRLPQTPDWSRAKTTSRLHNVSDTISNYERIPNYNILERSFSRRKQMDYDLKQSLMPLYQAQKKEKVGSTLSNAGVTASDLKALSAGTYGNSVFQGLDVLQGLRTLNQKKQVAQKINGTGLSASDVLEYAQQINRANEQNQAAEFADQHNILGTAATFPINVAAGIAGSVANTADYLAGKPINPDSFANSYANTSNAMRSAVSDDFGKVGQLMYNVGTSIGDSATAMVLAAGNPAVAGGIQGLNSYNNSIIDTANRGLTPDQIMATSTIAGLAEGAFEAIPLGRLKGIFTGSSKEAGENVIKSVLKQMASEGASEMTTEIINQAADQIINGGLSNYVQAVETYQKNGMSEEAAKKQAWNDIGKQVVYSGLAGAISGGIMGGGTAIAGKAVGNHNARLNEQNEMNLTDAQGIGAASAVTDHVPTKEGTPADSVSDLSNSLDNGAYHVVNALENSSPTPNVRNEHENNSVGTNIVENSQNVNNSDGFQPTHYEKGNGVDPFSDLMADNLTSAKGVTSRDKSFSDFVKESLSGDNKSGNKNYYLGKVSEELAADIFKETGIDVENYNIQMSSDNIRHSYKDHSDAKTEKGRNQIPLDAELIAKLPQVFDNPDVISFSSNPDTRGRNVIMFEKRINGKIIVAEAISAGKHRLSLDTMYIKDSHPVEAAATNVATSQRPKRSTGKATDVNIPNSTENVNESQYNSRKIEGFNDLDKALDRLVGMYKGNENTASMYADMKSAINEYLQTGNQSAIDRAVTLAANIDESLQGHSYTRKGNGKKTAKAMNSRVKTQFSEGEFVDTLMAYGKYLRDAAKSNSANTNQQANIDVTQNTSQQINQNIVPPQQPTSQNTDQSGNQRKRSYNDTLINKTDAPQALKNEFIANPDMYTQLSNAETSAKADSILANNDINSAMAQFRQMLDAKDPTAVPLGYNISKQLSEAGRVDEAVQIVRDMSKSLTESGQFSQAAAITMLNNDPQAALRYLVREIDSVNEAGKTKFKDKWNDFELTDSEVQQFNNIDPGDTEAIKVAYEKVYDRLRKEYPVTMTEKLMELRRISMLLNARTNVRNVVSNALIMPVRWTADRVTALGEGAYKLIHPEYEATQSVNPVRSKESRKLAAEAFETVRSELLGDSKYNDVNGAVRDKQVFKGSKFSQMFDNITNGALTRANQAMGKEVSPSLLETARNFTYYLLEKGDDVFVKKNFESRMASYLDAQGITDLESIPADAYTLATQEAYKATFKDDTKLARTLNKVRSEAGLVGDLIMPFTTTPANIAMRGIDYSPVGVANALVKLKNAKSNADVSSALTSLGQGATGTAAIAVGYALAQSGVIQGALSDDKDEAQWEKSHGKLAYSVKIGDNYYTFDWAQPASIPIILGATIYQCQNDSDSAINTALQGVIAASDAWLNLSPLQTLKDVLGGSDDSSAENIAEAILDTPLGWIPSQLGATARIGDTTQRVTYDNTSRLQNIINQAKSKIPGLSQTLPVSYDTWGNPIKRQDSTSEAAFANLLNPGQLGNVRETPIDDEITNLYNATGDAAVFPKKASWSYKINGETVKLNSEQYSEYQRVMGSNAYNMASALINSDSYANMSDDQKAGAISDLYNFADALAKSELLGLDIESSQTYKKMYEIYQDKGATGVATYLGIKQSMTGTKAEDKVSAVADLNASDEEKGYYLSLLVGDLSKEAQTAFDYNGYPGVYWYYAQKTGIGDYSGYKDAQQKKIQAMIDGTYEDPMISSHEENQAKIRAMLDGTYDSTYRTSESMSNREKIEAMLNGTYTNQDNEYQRRLQKIRDMLK
nr:MAG TPA: nuclease [Bacteriophage sp.]